MGTADRNRIASVLRWPALSWAVWSRAASNDVGIASAAIAFFGLLGLVPAISAIGLVCGWLSGPRDVLKAFTELCRLLPPGTRNFVLGQLSLALESGGRDGVVALVTTLGFGIYGLMSAAQALIDGLNLAYRLTEQRTWLQRTVIALTMALCGALAVVVMIAILLGIARWGNELIGMHRVLIFMVLPGVLVISVWLLTMVYRHAPAQQPGQRLRVLPGAIAAVMLGVASSAGFALYAAHLANFSATYGVLASVAPTLLWLQLASYSVLIGAAVNAQLPQPG